MWTSLLTNKITIAAIVVLIAGAYIFYLKNQLAVCKAENGKAMAELEISQASVKSLQGAIDEQNAAIEKLKTDAEARAKAGQALINKAKTEALVYKSRSEEIMRLTPKPGKSQCEAAEDLINEEIRSAK